MAIVGCGMIARFHARALQEIPQTRLVALVSRNEANARRMAE
ncbi:MAG: Gfo/Idh/MocA family oxidoreductase, partial [Gemmataceae bacterium]